MYKYSSVRKQVEKFGCATVRVISNGYMYVVRINKSSDDFDYDILKKWSI